jgi:hypothetical protein
MLIQSTLFLKLWGWTDLNLFQQEFRGSKYKQLLGMIVRQA